MKRADGFVITRSAREDWKRFGLPQTADEVVAAMFALPDHKIREASAGTIERPMWKVAHGRVFDRLVMIGGYKNTEGAWIAIHLVVVVGPQEGET